MLLWDSLLCLTFCICPSFCPPTHRYLHTSIHPFLHACMRPPPCMHASIHAYVHACMHACIHPSIQPASHPSMYACMHPSIHPAIHPCIHPSIHVVHAVTTGLHLFTTIMLFTPVSTWPSPCTCVSTSEPRQFQQLKAWVYQRCVAIGQPLKLSTRITRACQMLHRATKSYMLCHECDSYLGMCTLKVA